MVITVIYLSMVYNKDSEIKRVHLSLGKKASFKKAWNMFVFQLLVLIMY